MELILCILSADPEPVHAYRSFPTTLRYFKLARVTKKMAPESIELCADIVDVEVSIAIFMHPDQDRGPTGIPRHGVECVAARYLTRSFQVSCGEFESPGGSVDFDPGNVT